MKHIVTLTISNPSHEHISLRRRQSTTNYMVEARDEAEAIFRASNHFKKLGNYVHNAVIAESTLNEEVELDEAADYTLKHVGTSHPKDVTDDGDQPVKATEKSYEIHKGGKKVGELEHHHNEYGGHFYSGNLHGRRFPWNRNNNSLGGKNDAHSYLASALKSKWHTSKHSATNEEVEQIDEAVKVGPANHDKSTDTVWHGVHHDGKEIGTIGTHSAQHVEKHGKWGFEDSRGYGRRHGQPAMNSKEEALDALVNRHKEYTKKETNEEVELDEDDLSVRTLYNKYTDNQSAGKSNKPVEKAITKVHGSKVMSRLKLAAKASLKGNTDSEDNHFEKARTLAGGSDRIGSTVGRNRSAFRKSMGEEVEQIDELSSGLVRRYGGKAIRAHLTAKAKGDTATALKRAKGVNLASAKAFPNSYKPSDKAKVPATNEEVEQIDELQKSTLHSYVHKAMKDSNKSKNRAIKLLQNPNPNNMVAASDKLNKAVKRRFGIDKAISKIMAREEVESIDEVNARHSPEAAQAVLTPTAKIVRAAVGKTARDKAATKKYARRVANISPDYSKKDVMDHLKSMGEEVEQIDEDALKARQEWMKAKGVSTGDPKADRARKVKRLMKTFPMKKEEVEHVVEKAPPGAKYERMVKHIKGKYSEDGTLTPKEKAIAYATAWKAKNSGK